VRGFLVVWCHLNGQNKRDELKQHVTADMMKSGPNGKLSAEELQERMDNFFNTIQA